MANRWHLSILYQGARVWNAWREDHPRVKTPNLSQADLREFSLTGYNLTRANLSQADIRNADLSEANLRGANLKGANLEGTSFRGAEIWQADLSHATLLRADLQATNLIEANLRGANLQGAVLNRAEIWQADLTKANLCEATLVRADLDGSKLIESDLRRADLIETNLRFANLSGANLEGADLSRANLVRTNLSKANLSNCRIYGISAWKTNLNGATQSNLIISDHKESIITVDNLELAQFIYLLIDNAELRNIIDSVGRKVVLILGRFTPKRKAVIEAIRTELRNWNYVPVVFDFEKPTNRDMTEVVRTLAHLSRFVIADLTDPSSVPHELMSFVPFLPSVAVQPIINKGKQPYTMFEDNLGRYPWVLPIHEYETEDQLIAEIHDKIIRPTEDKVKEIHPDV